MGGASSRDYGRYEAEFVTSDLSMRGFAREKGLQPSALARMARKPDINGMSWYDKQQAYKARTAEKAYEILADKDAVQVAARMEVLFRVSDRMLSIIEKQIPVWEDQIAAGKTPFTPRDVSTVIDQVRALIGQPSQPKEDRRLGFLGIVASDGDLPDSRFAADLENAARSLLTDSGPDQGSPRPLAAVPSTD